jgi:hypothetical protein
VAVAHEEMHAETRSEAGEWGERRERDSSGQEDDDGEGEADDDFDSRRQRSDGRRERRTRRLAADRRLAA